MSPSRAEHLTWGRCSKGKAWHTSEKHWEPLQGAKCPSSGFSGLESFQMQCIFQVRLGEQQRFCRTHPEALWAPLFVEAFPELCLSSDVDMGLSTLSPAGMPWALLGLSIGGLKRQMSFPQKVRSLPMSHLSPQSSSTSQGTGWLCRVGEGLLLLLLLSLLIN